jgi:transcriptional regulator with XRE-family HTH domain
MTPDELKAARAELGLTQAEFAKVFQVDVRTVSGFETGVRNGRPSTIPGPLALIVGMALRNRTVRRELGIKS